MADQVWQPGIAERLLERRVARAIRTIGVTQQSRRVAIGRYGRCGRNNMRLPFGIDTVPDPYGQIAGERTEQRALSRSPMDRSRRPIARIDTNREWSRMRRRSGRDSCMSSTIKLEVGDGVTASAAGDFESCLDAAERLVEPGQAIDARRPLGDSRIGVDEPAQRRLDLPERQRGRVSPPRVSTPAK